MTSPIQTPPRDVRAGRVDAAAARSRWVLIVLWVLLPVGLGPALDDLLSGHTPTVQRVALTVLWAGWAGGAVAVLVPRTTSLTAIRVAAPGAAVVVPVAAVLRGGLAEPMPAAATAAALAHGVAVAALAGTAWIGHAFVNGSAYGDERRFLLRPPTVLFLGPLPLAWAVLVLGPVGGGVLVAQEHVVAGLLVLVVAAALALPVVRALHGLSRRWFVLVPAGMVVHDATALVDNVLLPRRLRPRLSPALSPPVAADGTEPLDLTVGAAGLVLQIDLRDPVPVTVRPRQRPGAGVVADTTDVSALLIAPSRPGLLLRTVAP